MNWNHHFNNRPAVDLTPFTDEQITAIERKRVGRSISEFQRGESSEARDYLSKSKAFANRAGAPSFYQDAVLFVKEENFHSDLLGQFMEQMGIELASEVWTDDIFRWVRSLGDIGWSSQVLLTAEILAQVYYPALVRATESRMLREICKRIIDDEDFHIQFQAERIAAVLQQRSSIGRAIHNGLAHLIFGGAMVVVWLEHQSVFNHTLSFSDYTLESWQRFRYVMRSINILADKNYAERQDSSSFTTTAA